MTTFLSFDGELYTKTRPTVICIGIHAMPEQKRDMTKRNKLCNSRYGWIIKLLLTGYNQVFIQLLGKSWLVEEEAHATIEWA